MTAPDVRTAAQTEAERIYPKYPSGEAAFEIDPQRHVKRKAYRAGAVWGAELVTPTREQIAEAIAGWHFAEHGLGYGEHTEVSRPLALKQADAVLALMNTQTERNH